ncbi:hypothetical protein QFZ66_005883 [Streptomyces sp. B4I13]|uniref:hypothetical protein n=1 Tax=Streptomyces sp. B4I13 TaxID=3042271 RepID=UPI0027858230|nr:hypothetical protein [Streptomyces sp. B4I13]MDQ0962005.1 hypothetical protein [Streptomyces sp. B4I13]
MRTFETAFEAANQAVTAATEAASAHVGDLLRDRLPTVTAILVDTEAAIVDSCYDSDGEPAIYNEAELGDLFDKVDAVIGQVLSLGNSGDVLARNGWVLTPRRPMAFFPVRIAPADRA